MPILRPCAVAYAVAALLPFSQGIADSSHARIHECGPSNIMVESSSRSDTRHACRGADAAIRFLSSYGFDVPALSIKIVAEMPKSIPESALGAFSRSRNEVYILAFSVFADRGRDSGLFNIPIDESVYRAVIAHEVAHAIALHNFSQQPTILAQEYIGFVTFFAALEKNRRENILWQYDYDEDWLQYSAILYLTDPLAFGAHAYRHFHRPENGRRFFQQILDGEAFDIDR